jgi:hypothetical protein
MPHGHELDGGVGKRLVQVERLLTRDAEDVLDALCLKAFNEDVRRFAFRHLSSLPG